MRYLSVLIILLLSGCASNSERNKLEKKANIFYSQGTYHLTTKHYTKAITNLLKAKKLNPKDSRIYNNLGMAYYFKNRKELARKHFAHALKLDKKNHDAKLNLASLSLEQGNVVKAQKLYTQLSNALTYDKQDQVYYNLAVLEMKKGNINKAKRNLKSSLDENQFYCPSSYLLAKIDYDKKNYTNALLKFKKAIKGTCFNNDTAQYYLGLTYLKKNKIVEGITQLQETKTRFPNTKHLSAIDKEIFLAERMLSRKEKQEIELSNRQNVLTPKF